MIESNLERTFDTLLKQYAPDIATPKKEYRFFNKRRWRFDRAWIDFKIAVELEGGIYSHGRHVRGQGFENDCIKYNTAITLGWVVFRVTSNMLKRDPANVIDSIRFCMMGRKAL